MKMHGAFQKLLAGAGCWEAARVSLAVASSRSVAVL
jgi:hypothetical protein